MFDAYLSKNNVYNNKMMKAKEQPLKKIQEKIICGVHSCCATADNFVTTTK